MPPTKPPTGIAPQMNQRYTPLTRPNRLAGTSCWRSDTATMLQTVVMAACTVVIATAHHVIGSSPIASIVTIGANDATTTANRRPTFSTIRPPRMPATRAPAPMMPTSTPNQPSSIPSSSVANSTNVLSVAANARLVRPRATAMLRSSRWRRSQPNPSANSRRIPALPSGAASARKRPRRLIVSSTATTKLAASTPKGSQTASANSALPIGRPMNVLAATSAE